MPTSTAPHSRSSAARLASSETASCGTDAQSLRLRPARRRDFGAVLELWLGLVLHHQHSDPAFRVPEAVTELLRSELRRAMRNTCCRVIVAEERAGRESSLIGFALAEIERQRSMEAGPQDVARGVCWVHELFVADGWRERGVGRALAAEVLGFFRERGYSRASVRVEAANPGALEFWRKVGFGERARILEGEL